MRSEGGVQLMLRFQDLVGCEFSSELLVRAGDPSAPGPGPGKAALHQVWHGRVYASLGNDTIEMREHKQSN